MGREKFAKDGLTRRGFLAGSAAFVAAAGTFANAPILTEMIGEDRPSGNTIYVCPPCGQACDKLTFDKPGKCPQCGMTLIDQAELISAPTVAILLFDRVEIIDFGGPWEVLGGAGYKVFTVAEKSDPVNCVYGQKVTPDYTFENSPRADILLVPGGGVANSVHNDKLIKWVQDNAKQSTHVMSVCTGAFILAQAGLLDGLTATTVRGAIDALATAGKNINTVHDKRYVDNGKIITTAGLSSGIDGALHLVSKIDGLGKAQLVALGIEYNWDPEGKFARAALADRYLPNMDDFKWKILSSSGDVERWELKALVAQDVLANGLLTDVGKQISAATPHARGPVQMGRANLNSLNWTFTDDEGRKWAGVGSLGASLDQKRSSVVTLRLARA